MSCREDRVSRVLAAMMGGYDVTSDNPEALRATVECFLRTQLEAREFLTEELGSLRERETEARRLLSAVFRGCDNNWSQDIKTWLAQAAAGGPTK